MRKNTCFICSLERLQFEKSGLDFDHHIKHEHNMWNYMKYLIYLDSKHQSQFDGGELYVQERFQGGFADWIPSNRSLYLGRISTS